MQLVILCWDSKRREDEWLGIALGILSSHTYTESEMLEVALHQAHQQFVIRSIECQRYGSLFIHTLAQIEDDLPQSSGLHTYLKLWFKHKCIQDIHTLL